VILQHIQNNKLFTYIILLFLFYSIESIAMEPIKFTIDVDEESLRFTLINTSYDDIVVSQILSVGPSGKRGNVELFFIDKQGGKHILSAKINFRRPKESDFISLSPDSFIGKIFSFEKVKSYYNLVPGVYKVEGFYKNYDGEKYGAYTGKSNTSKLSINIK